MQSYQTLFRVSSCQPHAPRLLDSVNDDFCNLWIKPRKNYFEYGNLKTEEMRNCVASASVICMYGVSLGESDNYIWNEIGSKHLNSRTCIVFYSYGLNNVQPGRRVYQKAKHDAEETLRIALGWDEGQYEAASDRIFIEPSSEVFKAKLKLNKNERFS